MEKTWVLPARKIDQAIAPDDRGTKIAQYRGVLYDLFLADLSDESFWPTGFPLMAKCIEKSAGRGASYMEITDVFEKGALDNVKNSGPNQVKIGSGNGAKSKKAK